MTAYPSVSGSTAVPIPAARAAAAASIEACPAPGPSRPADRGSGPEAGFGVYVHVPFCHRRCDYCAFATWTDRSHLMGDYARAAAVEVRRAVEGGMPPASSVFFGGGTPSLLPVDDLGVILAAIPVEAGAEVTVECNPETVDLARLTAYRDLGVNRLSFGVQSMVPHVLQALGRVHDPASVRRAAAAAGAAGFDGAYSVDLIYGAVGESILDWRQSLSQALALDPAPAHVSAYGLTAEAGTPLGRDVTRHPDGDDQADKYELADDLLGQAGLEWYELSNWARPGAASTHNRLYWQQGQYRGIGCAAHSHARTPGGGARRWWNVRTPERYLERIGAGRPAEAGGEDLDGPARRREAFHLALRTRDGVAAAEVVDLEALATVRSAGLVEDAAGPAGPRLVLTRTGRLLANEVAVRLAP